VNFAGRLKSRQMRNRSGCKLGESSPTDMISKAS
jgi:hypothetical protein